MSEVGSFFDREASNYFAGNKEPNSSVAIARAVEDRVRGDVLCIGGVWHAADLDALARRSDLSLTVADLSEQMLERWRDVAKSTVVADARELPFDEGTFDFVVVPLVLHHITDDDADRARDNVARVTHEAKRVLRPGGTLVIIDFDLPGLVYEAQRWLAPVTRRLLALRDIPLVVMHTLEFYERTVRATGFEDVESRTPGGDNPFELMQPIIGLPMLRIPRGLYPLRRFVLSARRP